MTTPNELNAKALDPQASAVVSACAGSGKTWLLVSRIVRALLDGAKPSEILAITFTRKAAQEMSARLREWLRLLATEEDAVVAQMLAERAVPPSRVAAMIPVARQLYERCLTAEPGITVTTFHSWFLQLLRRAPLDAGALGEVKLTDETAALMSDAWRRFARRVQSEPASAAAQGLDRLFGDYGLDSTRRLLTKFVQQRADWWAYGLGHDDPVRHALDQMAAQLPYEPDEDISGALWREASFVEMLEAYEGYLAAGVSRGRASAEKLAQARCEVDASRRFDLTWRAVLTEKGEPRKYSANKKQEAALGADRQQRFFELHADLSARIGEVMQGLADQRSYHVNRAALRCGVALLDEYQSLKQERQVIDYGDIEWRAWRLLSEEEHAMAMQCKLDARYRHVLLDEFQDTNPLQWLTLQSWFAAAAAADSHPRVFVVGDPKQSIYRFRRAEARLFARASAYLAEGFGAHRLSQDESRRCAPAVLDVVNRLFAAEGMDDFRPHQAHYGAKPGRVEVWPVAAKNARLEVGESGELRNPFVTPLIEQENSQREREAALVAERIAAMRGTWWVAEDDRGERGRPARYGDILLLARRRTHLETYERALRHAGIPFVTSRQGGLLDTLEVQDLLALLEFLMSPFDDLKLAHALRSPVFGCSDDDLIAIAVEHKTYKAHTANKESGNAAWWDSLCALAARGTSDTLKRAQRLLACWMVRADALPVHDQLDRIYFEADVPRRYADAVPAAMREAVAANLDAFMQRALDTDAGRYPSLPRFITELKALREAPDQEAPDEGAVVNEAGAADDVVRILTVHGAKGLEAPIVWLLDAAAGATRERGYDVLLDWPEAADKPRHFSLYTRKAEMSRAQRVIFDNEAAYAAREELNLLYVAMTRAKQALIVSGIDGNGRDRSWHEKIRAAVCDVAGLSQEDAAPAVAGVALDAEKYQQKQIFTNTAPIAVSPDPRLAAPLPTGLRREPMLHVGMEHGSRFHLLMEHLTRVPAPARAALQRLLAISVDEFDALWQDAQRLVSDEQLARYFDPGRFVRATNEMPFVTADGDTLRIDRLVEFADDISVLDYKTGALDTVAPALLGEYRAQVENYCVHMTRVFTGKPVNGIILFTGGGMVRVSPRARPAD